RLREGGARTMGWRDQDARASSAMTSSVDPTVSAVTLAPIDAARIFGPEDERLDAIIDAERYNQTSPYNHFGYRPVREEHLHAPARVSGSLPTDLEGVYLRNGTNVQFDRVTVRAHAFNGAGMIHQVQI